MNSNKKTARIAGILYLLMAAFGLAAEVFFRQKLLPNATIETIMMLPMMIAEFSFMFYLLIRGNNKNNQLSQKTFLPIRERRTPVL